MPEPLSVTEQIAQLEAQLAELRRRQQGEALVTLARDPATQIRVNVELVEIGTEGIRDAALAAALRVLLVNHILKTEAPFAAPAPSSSTPGGSDALTSRASSESSFTQVATTTAAAGDVPSGEAVPSAMMAKSAVTTPASAAATPTGARSRGPVRRGPSAPSLLPSPNPAPATPGAGSLPAAKDIW